jgi:hypothetical protein
MQRALWSHGAAVKAGRQPGSPSTSRTGEIGFGLLCDNMQAGGAEGLRAGRRIAAFICVRSGGSGVHARCGHRPPVRHRVLGYRHELLPPAVGPAAPAGWVRNWPAGDSSRGAGGRAIRPRASLHRCIGTGLQPDGRISAASDRLRGSDGQPGCGLPKDVEAQVFYALALLAAASPSDKTHARQKRTLQILEPLYEQYPQHPGIAHYLIHACDNAELARQGVSAARAYATIAPSAPHALHMPSHIFTRLGMWPDSIDSNQAARTAAHEQGDLGEELHAMDYLVYAYLQEGREREANEVVKQLTRMPKLDERDFKVSYASTAMPIRYAVERRQWSDAASLTPPQSAPPQVIAIAVWSQGLGLARNGHAGQVHSEIDRLHQLEQQLRTSAGESGTFASEYWATQVRIQALEASAWLAQADGRAGEAQSLLRAAADEEDAVEKLPVTPGAISPARQQLGDLLLTQDRPEAAAKEFQSVLINSLNRRGALTGLSRANELMTNH